MTTTMTEETQRQSSSQLPISLLDYGAGNVRSVYNAIVACGYPNVQLITTPAQILEAKVIIFPGVGSYHSAMTVLQERGYDVALKEYLAKGDRPYLGICLGMQTLFEGSDEIMHRHNNCDDKGKVEEEDKDELPGLGIIPGRVIKFDATTRSVPHIGWNGVILHQQSPAMKYLYPTPSSITTTTAATIAATTLLGSEVYFVHSYYAPIIDDTDSSNTSSSSSANTSWILTSTTYEGQAYISSIQKGSIVATQFHPEKSGIVGLNFLRGFLEVRERGTCVCVLFFLLCVYVGGGRDIV
jgi:glutamine amidotransferase/cyclase